MHASRIRDGRENGMYGMSKFSIERMTKIVRFIHNRGSISMAFLMRELEASEASVKRDLEFLRDRMVFPLE